MPKKKTVAQKRPTKVQRERINHLGVQIYGDNWEKAKARVLPTGMTYEGASVVLRKLDNIIGGRT